MNIRRLVIHTLVACLLASTPVFAVEPGEMLDDPVLEGRARDISAGLRCLVCQNQSIDDSNAQLAIDLRVLVRERLVMGDSNDQVVDYVVSRYGDFVLLSPPVKASTYVLWFGPVLIVMFGIFVVATVFRRRNISPIAAGDSSSDPTSGPRALSEEEKKRLADLLDDSDRNRKTGEIT